MRRLTARLLLTLAACSPVAAQDADLRFTGDRYPIDVSIRFSAALLHWVDSLADLRGFGLSGGKTVPIHRETYRLTFGLPDEAERRMLDIYAGIRRRYAAHEDAARARALLLAFLEEPDIDRALARARTLLDPVDFVELRRILLYFSSRYEKLWREGRIPHRFIKGVPKRERRKLETLLARLREFFDTDLTALPRPRLVLAPVAGLGGTHAQADGHLLLVELRPQDRLAETASVIVHENAHFLFLNSEPRVRDALRRLAEELDREEARDLLREALPTALGQGVAARRFERTWSEDQSWYHREEIDRYAKSIYPLVEQALAAERPRLDEALIRKLLERWQPTPRSP